jgi:colanic acid biosynthesis glycosyl transferase WcaI
VRQIKVLVITGQYAPDYGPSAPIYTALCEGLQQMGCDVTVVTAFPHYAQPDGPNRYAGKLFAREKRNGVNILRTYVVTVPKSSLRRRLLYHASFNVFSTLAALRVKKPDVVLADAPTLWSGLSLLAKAVFPGIPYIYIVHDIYPDILVRLGMLNNDRLVDLINRLERFFYKKSAHVSVLSEGFKKNLMGKNVPEKKITIIPACVDADFVRPLPRENQLRRRLGLKGKFVALYAGNLGFSQSLETLLKAAKRLAGYPDIVFVFVGDGAKKIPTQARAEQEGLKNVVFSPFLPREDVPFVYAMADIGFVCLRRDIVVESVPSKTYTIMASGRPVVASVDRQTEVGSLLEQTRCGLCTEPENAAALAEAVLRLYKDDDLRTEMGRRGRDFVVEYLSTPVASKLYFQLIERCVAKGELN